MLVRCPACGMNNRPNARFCVACGQPLEQLTPYRPLQPGQLLRNGRYRVIRPLTTGGMGKLYLAEDREAFGRLCVVKEMLDYFDPTNPAETASAQRRFEQEARTLAELGTQRGIPEILSFFVEAGRCYIVMQYIEGEDLQSKLEREGPQPIADVVHWGIELCRILELLASRQPPIVHHDIKPSNVIIQANTGDVYLIDFGAAKARLIAQPGGQVGIIKSSVYGTEGYAPPEQYEGKSEPRSDVYALAATLYHVATGDDPRNHPFTFPQLAQLPSRLRRALSEALALRVEERPDAVSFRVLLERALHRDERHQPFYFRSGEVAHNLQQFVQLCEKHWHEATNHLSQGHFENWLSSIGRGDLALAARHAVRAAPDANAALELFLQCTRMVAPPQRIVCPKEINFGKITPEQTAQVSFSVTNRDRGWLFGTATAIHHAVDITPRRFSGNHLQFQVNIDTRGLQPGSKLRTAILLQFAWGGEVRVPVAVDVALPSVAIAWITLTHLMCVALIATTLRGVLAFASKDFDTWAIGVPYPPWWMLTAPVGAWCAAVVAQRRGRTDWIQCGLLAGLVAPFSFYLVKLVDGILAAYRPGTMGNLLEGWAIVGGLIGLMWGIYRALTYLHLRRYAILSAVASWLLAFSIVVAHGEHIAVAFVPPSNVELMGRWEGELDGYPCTLHVRQRLGNFIYAGTATFVDPALMRRITVRIIVRLNTRLKRIQIEERRAVQPPDYMLMGKTRAQYFAPDWLRGWRCDRTGREQTFWARHIGY